MTTKSLAWTLAALFLVLGFGPASAASPAGDWLGTLTPSPGVSLRLALHIEESAPGTFSATWDSVDQGLFDGALTNLSISPTALAFDITRPKAHFAATWDAAEGVWVGQWTQSGVSLPLTLARGVAPPGPTVAGLDGDWDGALEGLGARLRLAFHIRTGRRGTIGTLDSIDQQAMGLPISNIGRDGAKITFGVKVVGGGFQGELDPKGEVIAGRWSQGGRETPLTLTRRAAGVTEAVLNRPQTPKPPYPYAEEEVGFDTPGAKAHLAGTLTLPKGAGPFPAVILVSGSGPNTRDEPILGHRLFLVIADHLTRHGVAVLRYDKRGVGASTGDYAKATTQDFADDAAAAVAYLRTRKDIDPRRTGLIGHSEGGLIVPIVAARDPTVDFIVLMAGPGVNGAEVWIEQLRLILLASGMAEKDVAAKIVERRKMVAVLRGEPDLAKAAAELKAVMPADTPADQTDALIKAVNTPWFRSFFDYEPAPTLAQVRCPVLAIAGSKDLQVSPPQNLPALRAALAHNPDATVEELPSLNHLFQTAKTGGIGEYGVIEETISPAALDVVTDWILKHLAASQG